MEQYKKILETETESGKDISSKWIDGIYNSLERLEYYERLLKTGHDDIESYIVSLGYSNSHVKTALTQIKIIQSSITEFEILFDNARKVIKKDNLKILRGKLGIAIKTQGEGDWYQTTRINGTIKRVALKKDFYFLVRLLSDIRKEIVSELSHILWVGKETDEEQGGEV